jgi:hypothetical protein
MLIPRALASLSTTLSIVRLVGCRLERLDWPTPLVVVMDVSDLCAFDMRILSDKDARANSEPGLSQALWRSSNAPQTEAFNINA